MGRNRIRSLVPAVLSLILAGVAASQAAYAAPAPSAPVVKIPSSGIGLPANLPAKGVGLLRNAADYEKASKSSRWAQTSAGLVFRSCMYNVPSGSYVDSIHGRITEPNGRVLPLTRCPYPRLAAPNAAPAARPAPAATGGTLSGNTANWIDGFEADGLPHLGYLSATLAAPYPPTLGNGALWEYQWTALGSLSADTLLQPAVGWGKLVTQNTNRSGNPLSGDTEMASYYFWGGNAVSGTFYSVNPLDTLHVSIQGYNCGSGGGGCTWWMQISDQNTGQDSQLTVGSSPTFTSVFGEFESNVGSIGGTNCQYLFANHHLVWRNLNVIAESGATVTPSYIITGYNDFGAGQAVWNATDMITSWSTTNGFTAADTTWSNSCSGF